MLKGFMNDHKKILDDIFNYCIFRYTLDNNCGIDEALSFFGCTAGNKERTMCIGSKLFKDIKDKRFTGIIETYRNSVYWEFYKHEKSDFDKAVLLMFLALKSMVGEKMYYKITNKNILFNRMAGQDDKSEFLPKEIAKFCTRYQVGKIEMELMEKYKVSIYAYHTRGKYYSLKMTIDELAKVAEDKKQTNRRKKHTDEVRQAYYKAKQDGENCT